MMHKAFQLNPFDVMMEPSKAQSLGFEHFTQHQQELADKLIQNINDTVKQRGMKCFYKPIPFEGFGEKCRGD